MTTKRESGILLHPTSLPSIYGIGDFGSSAYKFIDFLQGSGQSLWQMLPLGPTGFGNSPYQTHSAYAGNPNLISLDILIEDGLLTIDEQAIPHFGTTKVSYDSVKIFKYAALHKAFENFKHDSEHPYHNKFKQFIATESSWIDDYALYMALKEYHQQRPWHEWEPALRDREPEALEQHRRGLALAIEFEQFIQFLFFYQFELLCAYAKEKSIQFIGDIPIFVAHDSSDVWSHPEWFLLDSLGEPTVVAGVPPDYFSATGQRWGNPLYDWRQLALDGYSFWIDRFRHTAKMFDLIRIDHFRGFVDYWEIPASEETAINGRWCKGPGIALFKAMHASLGDRLPIIAEDLGIITDDVRELLMELGYPGMAVLQFGFQSMQSCDTTAFLPHNLQQNQVVYTGTHDNETLLAWWGRQTYQVQTFTKQYLNTDAKVIHRDFIRTALGSVSQRAIFPMQDLLGLHCEGNMNRPGTMSGNWEWRMQEGDLNRYLQRDLYTITKLYGRCQ